MDALQDICKGNGFNGRRIGTALKDTDGCGKGGLSHHATPLSRLRASIRTLASAIVAGTGPVSPRAFR